MYIGTVLYCRCLEAFYLNGRFDYNFVYPTYYKDRLLTVIVRYFF